MYTFLLIEVWRASHVAMMLRRAAMMAAVTLVAAKDHHAAIHSTRGQPHDDPLASDNFVVGCIMIMFLMLFAFGACHLQHM